MNIIFLNMGEVLNSALPPTTIDSKLARLGELTTIVTLISPLPAFVSCHKSSVEKERMLDLLEELAVYMAPFVDPLMKNLGLPYIRAHHLQGWACECRKLSRDEDDPKAIRYEPGQVEHVYLS